VKEESNELTVPVISAMPSTLAEQQSPLKSPSGPLALRLSLALTQKVSQQSLQTPLVAKKMTRMTSMRDGPKVNGISA
jgi:hypothetical protein